MGSTTASVGERPTVDMTKSGLAEPIVDEMAAIPLDLWAQKQGYTKLQTNLMQL